MNSWNMEYSIEVDVDNRIVFEKIYGVWRVETALAYSEDFKLEVDPLIKQPWAKLVNLSNWKTASHEVVQIVGEHLAWCREHNMAVSINIIDNPVTYGQLMRMWAKGKTKKMSQTFRTIEEGRKALRELGYNL
jgi:hypothetical protein